MLLESIEGQVSREPTEERFTKSLAHAGVEPTARFVCEVGAQVGLRGQTFGWCASRSFSGLYRIAHEAFMLEPFFAISE